MLIWSLAMRKYTMPKSRQKNVFIAYFSASVPVSRVCSRHVRASRSLKGVQNAVSARLALDRASPSSPLGAASSGFVSISKPANSFSILALVVSMSSGVR